MTNRKLIVLTNDLPYPPNHGHKVDQDNRWRGFAQAGFRLQLIHWCSPFDPPTTAADAEALRAVYETVDALPIRHDPASLLRRLARLPRYPSHVASRIPDRATFARLVAQARAFGPGAVVLDGIYGGVLGTAIAKACAVPLIVRGHNIEHRYFAQQARAARSARSRIAWTLARIGLARYERALLARAARVFDISTDDIAYWRGQGIERLEWAPTVFPDAAPASSVPPAARQWDVAYIGNLRLPNNLAGLRWFVAEVLPGLRALRPDVRVCIAGANPGAEARALLEGVANIDLVPDAPSADDILSQGRVLMNPILSGSGVNVKSIDMLRYDAPIVTTAIGAQGFPPEVQAEFRIMGDAGAFARALDAAIADPGIDLERRAAARAWFGGAGLARQIAAYEAAIDAGAGGAAASNSGEP